MVAPGGFLGRGVSGDAEHSDGMLKVPSERQQTPNPQRRQRAGCFVRVCAEGGITSLTARTPRGSSSPGSGRLKLTVLSEDRLQMKWKETEGNINGYKVRVKPMAGMCEHVGCQIQAIDLCIRDETVGLWGLNRAGAWGEIRQRELPVGWFGFKC